MIRTAMALSACLLLATTSGAAAKQVCAKRPDMLNVLSKLYSEVPVAMGLSPNGVVEILSSPEGTSWTMILTTPNGVTCITAGGRYWGNFPRTPLAEAMPIKLTRRHNSLRHLRQQRRVVFDPIAGHRGIVGANLDQDGVAVETFSD